MSNKFNEELCIRNTGTWAKIKPEHKFDSSKFNKDNLPSPDNVNVIIETVDAEYVAVITFGGFANESTINENKALLATALKKKGIVYHGNFRYLGYNPPYQLVGRRNEVIVAVDGDFKL